MKKIMEYFSQIEKDKLLHIVLCLLIAQTAGWVMKVAGGDKSLIVFTAWLAGFTAGIIKELYDERKYKGADERDWAADVIGTTLGTLYTLLYIL